jgi:hypothetical protein
LFRTNPSEFLLVSFCWLCLFLRNDCRVHRVEINSLFELLLVWKERLFLESIFLQDQVHMLGGFYTKFVLHSKGQNDPWKSKLESIIKKIGLVHGPNKLFLMGAKTQINFIICQLWQKSIPTKVINTLPIGLVWPQIMY